MTLDNKHQGFFLYMKHKNLKPGDLLWSDYEYGNQGYNSFYLNRSYTPSFRIEKNEIIIVLKVGDELQLPGVKILSLQGVCWVNSNFFEVLIK